MKRSHRPERSFFDLQRSRTLVAAAAAMLLLAGTSLGEDHSHAHEDLDRRLTIEVPTKSLVAAPQAKALAALRADSPDLRAPIDARTGATSSLSSALGALTGPATPGFDPETVARDYLSTRRVALGLEVSDLEDMILVDHVKTSLTGTDHFYFQQRHHGIPVYEGQLQVHVGADGRVESVSNRFLPGLQSAVNALAPDQEATAAIRSGLKNLGVGGEPAIETIEVKLSDAQRTSRIDVEAVTDDAVEAELVWLPVAAGDARLAWKFILEPTNDLGRYEMTVDAVSGEVWTRFNQVTTAVYKVQVLPKESPYTSTWTIPNDSRSDYVTLGGPPAGWHTSTRLSGNNVDAIPGSGPQPDCGPNYDCSFPLNFPSGIPSYTAASVANLFYVVNRIHDVHYEYGFDEQAGNFQNDNFGKGGSGGDAILAVAQAPFDHKGPRWFPEPDGIQPTLYMPLFRYDGPPTRDTVWDNLVVAHEYGHGISSRLVGGRSTVSCLNDAQSRGLGEGWSDFIGLWYTADAGDEGTDARGIGHWTIGELPSHPGMRPQRYSTNRNVNDYTYRSILDDTAVHSVGSVWAQALWEVHWDLVDKYGFDARVDQPWHGAGNHRSMLYVTDGLKRAPCNPSFLDARDAILDAVAAYNGGEDQCLVWDAFAEFGLGTDATGGGSSTYSGVADGFELPAGCCGVSTPTYLHIGAGNDTQCTNNSVTYTTDVASNFDVFRWQLLDSSNQVIRTTTTTAPFYSLAGIGLSAERYTLRVRAERTCGAVSGWRSRPVDVEPETSPYCGGGCGPIGPCFE